MVYYNEIDEFAVAWLNELIAAKVIADGVVDARSIIDVDIRDLEGFDQCHFFAGIGVWSYALRRAGWPDDRAIWTGSCPCQPFSASGKQKGFDDERHLWPIWANLIALGRPPVITGEQVASPAGLHWFDLVSADLESQDYAVAAADLCAASVGAPHIRQRLYFVGDTHDSRSQGRIVYAKCAGERAAWTPGLASQLADAGSERRQQDTGSASCHESANGRRSEGHHQPTSDGENGFWSACDWLPCRDGKSRPVEPGTFPLATGAPARVGRLRGYGNAINAEVATVFIEAYMSIR